MLTHVFVCVGRVCVCVTCLFARFSATLPTYIVEQTCLELGSCSSGELGVWVLCGYMSLCVCLDVRLGLFAVTRSVRVLEFICVVLVVIDVVMLIVVVVVAAAAVSDVEFPAP